MNDWFEAEQRVERAQELYESGRWEDAARELEAALRINPDNGEWQFNLGLTFEAMGRNADAIDALHRAVELQGEDSEALNLLGTLLCRESRLDEAQRCFERAEAANPSDVLSYANRIDVYARRNDHERAETMFYLALEADEDHPRAYLYMGQSLFDRGRYDRAIWCWQQVLRLDPSDEQVYAKLAEAHWARNEYEHAYRCFLQQLRRDPGDTGSLLDMGNLLVEMERTLEAAEKFRRAIEIEPNNAEAHLYLGELALKSGHVAAAEQALHRARRFDRRMPGVRTKLAAIRIKQNRLDEARRMLIAELALDASMSRTPAQRGELGELLLEMNLPVEAVGIYRGLAEEFPQEPAYLNQWAVALFVTGDLIGGMQIARRAVRLDRKFILAMHNLASAHLRLGQFRRAAHWLERARRVDRKDKRLRRLRRAYRVAVVRNRAARLLPRRRRTKTSR